jgi:hypothetical protein
MLSEIPKTRRGRSQKTDARLENFEKWLDGIPKVEGHYCRRNSQKQYLNQDFECKAEVFKEYRVFCEEKTIDYFKRTKFYHLLKKYNIAIFKQKKDLCDVCIQYKCKQITQSVFNSHLEKKQNARAAKADAKQKSLDGTAYCLQMDLQAVKVLPWINSSKSYYKQKLQIHNYTIYNLQNKDAFNYWFSEVDGNLES